MMGHNKDRSQGVPRMGPKDVGCTWKLGHQGRPPPGRRDLNEEVRKGSSMDVWRKILTEEIKCRVCSEAARTLVWPQQNV